MRRAEYTYRTIWRGVRKYVEYVAFFRSPESVDGSPHEGAKPMKWALGTGATKEAAVQSLIFCYQGRLRFFEPHDPISPGRAGTEKKEISSDKSPLSDRRELSLESATQRQESGTLAS